MLVSDINRASFLTATQIQRRNPYAYLPSVKLIPLVQKLVRKPATTYTEVIHFRDYGNFRISATIKEIAMIQKEHEVSTQKAWSLYKRSARAILEAFFDKCEQCPRFYSLELLEELNQGIL